MAACDGTRSDHCCWVKDRADGTCRFLTRVDGRWRCQLMLEHGDWDMVTADPRWRDAPIGRWFAKRYPGYGCGDWPQNIPEVWLFPTTGKCCYAPQGKPTPRGRAYRLWRAAVGWQAHNSDG